MPHILLDHSENIKISGVKNLFNSIHHILHTQLDAKIAKCRSRVVNSNNTLVGDGSADLGYVHLDVILKSGYEPIVIERTGNIILDTLKEVFTTENLDFKIEFSIELKEVGKYYIK